MRAFYGWWGPGRGYDKPDTGDARKTAKDYGRQDTNPTATFRFRQGPASIFSASGQNMSGTSYESEHEGVNPTGQGSMGNSKPV